MARLGAVTHESAETTSTFPVATTPYPVEDLGNAYLTSHHVSPAAPCVPRVCGDGGTGGSPRFHVHPCELHGRRSRGLRHRRIRPANQTRVSAPRHRIRGLPPLRGLVPAL